MLQQRHAIYPQPLSPDEGVEQRAQDALYGAFKPFRCVVEFEDHGSRIAVTIYGHDRLPYAVAGKSVHSLRDPEALARYVRDIRYSLRQRGMIFTDLEP